MFTTLSPALRRRPTDHSLDIALVFGSNVRALPRNMNARHKIGGMITVGTVYQPDRLCDHQTDLFFPKFETLPRVELSGEEQRWLSVRISRLMSPLTAAGAENWAWLKVLNASIRSSIIRTTGKNSEAISKRSGGVTNRSQSIKNSRTATNKHYRANALVKREGSDRQRSCAEYN